MKRWRSRREIDNIFGTIRTCFVHVLSKFSGSTWERNFRMEVQIGDTRRVLFINPPRSLNELTTAISHEIPKTRLWILVYFTKTTKGSMWC